MTPPEDSALSSRMDAARYEYDSDTGKWWRVIRLVTRTSRGRGKHGIPAGVKYVEQATRWVDEHGDSKLVVRTARVGRVCTMQVGPGPRARRWVPSLLS